jgi:hypothetical protein
MKRIWGIVAAVAMVGTVGTASAQKFEEAASDAVEVRSPEAFAAILWSFNADCSTSSSDMERRQCEGIKAARRAQVEGNTYLVNGDAKAFQVGEYDKKKKSVELKLLACVACVTALDVDGNRHYVVGNKGKANVSGGSVAGPQVHVTSKAFKTAALANKWKNKSVPRLRTQFLVKVPSKANTWKSGSVGGYQVEIVGFRVYDPCDGKVVCASPKSDKGVVDKKTCGDDVVSDIPEHDPKPKVDDTPKGPVIPDRLSTDQIKQVLKPATLAAEKCFETYGVAGKAWFKITFSSDGALMGAVQTGDFKGTPTGDCIQKAVDVVTFPESKKKKTTVKYPFNLR